MKTILPPASRVLQRRRRHLPVQLPGRLAAQHGSAAAQQVCEQTAGLCVRALERVLATEPDPDPVFVARHDIQLVGLETLLRESDFVSLHVRLNEHTRGMLGPEVHAVAGCQCHGLIHAGVMETGEREHCATCDKDVFSVPLLVKVSATGNLQPTNQVDVGSELSGIVEKVFVDLAISLRRMPVEHASTTTS